MEGSSQHEMHTWRLIEQVKEWFLSDVIQVHYFSPYFNYINYNNQLISLKVY